MRKSKMLAAANKMADKIIEEFDLNLEDEERSDFRIFVTRAVILEFAYKAIRVWLEADGRGLPDNQTVLEVLDEEWK